MMHVRSFFIFRRDLRLEDNTALMCALGSSDEVAAAFIFDPRQCEAHDYFSPNAFQFLCQSLDELSAEIEKRGGRLYLFYGKAEEVVEALIKECKFDAVFINKDYTPFSRRRDTAIKKVCSEHGAVFEEHDDALLCPPGSVIKGAGGPYAVFTPFWKKARTQEVRLPRTNTANHFSRAPLKSQFTLKKGQLADHFNARLSVMPGRLAGLKLLKNVCSGKDYLAKRDIPSLDATSHLSAHLKFGTVSAREVFYALKALRGDAHPMIEQLYWRDFFTHVAYYFPHVFSGCFYEEYDAICWSRDKDIFLSWCEGSTGVPLVDAGMRELNTTGFMHNRVRMVVASYLVKDLHIDWRWGERYFATRLVDYDPALNNGNWQWAASTGCDHQPYFRIFNPWRQQGRFDPQCAYIKKWVPELKARTPKEILAMEVPGEHVKASEWIKDAFKNISRSNDA